MDIRKISAEEARPVRAAILRPGQPPEASVYPLDERSETLHVGAYTEGELVTVASIFNEPPPNKTNPQAWRLRGMVTLPQWQRRGYGRAVMGKCFGYIAEQGGTLLWCNARMDAIEFYRSLGFDTVGDEQKTPRGTSFIRMHRAVTLQDLQSDTE